MERESWLLDSDSQILSVNILDILHRNHIMPLESRASSAEIFTLFILLSWQWYYCKSHYPCNDRTEKSISSWSSSSSCMPLSSQIVVKSSWRECVSSRESKGGMSCILTMIVLLNFVDNRDRSKTTMGTTTEDSSWVKKFFLQPSLGIAISYPVIVAALNVSHETKFDFYPPSPFTDIFMVVKLLPRSLGCETCEATHPLLHSKYNLLLLKTLQSHILVSLLLSFLCFLHMRKITSEK